MAGTEVAFAAPTSGAGPFSFQWFRNGVLMQGDTTQTLNIMAQSSDNGTVYTVAVSNPAGTVTATFTLTVNSPPTITTQPQDQTLPAGSVMSLAAAATGTAPLSYQWTRNGVAIPGATGTAMTTPALSLQNNGDQYALTVSNPFGSASSHTATPTVLPLQPVLTFQPVPNKTFGDPAFNVSAASVSQGAVTYSVLSGPATVAGSTVTVNGAGTVVLAANQVASGDYSPASASASFNVAVGTDKLSFTPVPNKTFGDPAFNVSAASASQGAVTYNVLSGPATISGATVTLTGAGPVVLAANQAASGNYSSGAASVSFTVAPGAANLSFNPVPNKTFGDPVFPVSAVSVSQGAVTYSVVSGPATVAGSTITVTGVGPVVLAANQAADGNYAAASASTNFTVNPATPALAFTPVSGRAYGDPAFTVNASSASQGAVTYSVVSGNASIAGSTVTVTGTGPVTLAATQAANGNYGPASASTSFTVTAAIPTLTFTPVPNKTYGDPAFTVSAASASPGVVTYAVTSGSATIAGSTVTITGTGPVVLSASQAASGNYAATSASSSFTVNAATPSLAFAPITSRTYGDPAFAVSASSASQGAVTYSVTSGPATIAGSTVTIAGAGPVVLTANQVANGNYAAASASTSFTVNAATPTLTFTPVPNKTYGDPAFTVNASSASQGTVTYSVTSGNATIAGSTVTVNGAGPVVLAANQVANGNYAAGSASTSFTVNTATPTLTFTPVPNKTYGDPAFTVNASSASQGAVTYSVTSGNAIITGSTVSLTGPGTILLAANQAANGNYSAASGSTSFTVAQNVSVSPISPANQTFAPAQQTFEATASGGNTNGLTWTATGGSISAGGVWTPPTTPGTYTIKATSTDDTSKFVTTTATISIPVITSQPASQNLCNNGNISLAVTASYGATYQWSLNNSAIAGANSASYFFPGATSAQDGTYTVAVTNGAGTVTSAAATVVVGSLITSNPSNLTITQYQTAGFDVAASGKAPFAYQWYTVPAGASSGTLLSGASASMYVTPVQMSPTSSPVGYYAVVTDSCGTAITSATAQLTVQTGYAPPTITSQPTGQTVSAGSNATFTAAATGAGTLSYQWYRIPNGGTNQELAGVAPVAGTAVAGATSASYTAPSASTNLTNDQDEYYLVVSNAYGQAVSQNATLAVGPGIQVQITGQPQDAYVNGGTPATFTVSANSTVPLSYQWYMVPAGHSASAQSINTPTGTTTTTASAVAISGATGPSYTIPAALASQTGTAYYAVVSNGQTSAVTSSAAALFVDTPAGIPSCDPGWTALGSATPFNSGTCSYQLTAATTSQHGEIVWPSLIATGSLKLSFTVATSNPSSPPADGFAVILGDPTLGATTNIVGDVGEGLGARGIPGFVVAFDDYYNAACTSSCSPAPYPSDPSTSSNPAYLGVGRGESSLWENPYFNVNNSLPGGQYALAQSGRVVSHNYVLNLVNGYMSVTMDGLQVFSGYVSVPPVAYLYVTSSTGGSYEQTVVSNIAATVVSPSH